MTDLTRNYYRGKKVLVTGAGGFIPSHLTEELLRSGADVTALVRYNGRGDWGWIEEFEPELRKNLKVIPGDITDPRCAQEAARGREIVFHLAALIAIPYSYRSPFHYIRTNVEGTATMLHASMECGVKRFVHTSTSEVYGTAQYVPIDEKHPLQGQSPYSASKIGGDMIAESFQRSYGFPVAIIRPFNTYGPRQSARAVIPTIMSQALSGAKKIRLGSLTPKRDFTFVADSVQGFLLGGMKDEAVGRVINLGTGGEITIGDLVGKIRGLAGASFEIETDDERIRPEKSEVMRLCSDISLARKLLGYEPRVSMDEGLERTWNWLKKNLHRYKPEIYNV